MRTPSMDTATALAVLAERADPEAWSALVERHGAAIHRLTLRILGDASLAEDAAQESLLAIRAWAPRFAPPADEGERAATAWIMRIASRCALQIARGRSARERRERRAAEIATPQPETERGAEDDATLHRALAELGDAQRQILHLRFFADLEYTEIARVEGLTVNGARVRVHRALAALRALLERDGHARDERAIGFALAACAALVPPTPDTIAAWRELLHQQPHHPGIASSIGGSTIMTTIAIAATLSVCALLVFTAVDRGSAAEATPPPATTGPGVAAEDGAPALRVEDLAFTIDFQDAKLVDVATFFSDTLRVPVRIDPIVAAASPPPVTLRVDSMQSRHIFDFIARLTNLHGERLEDGTILFTNSVPDAAQAPDEAAAASAPAGIDWSREYPPTIVAVEHASSREFMRAFFQAFGGDWHDAPDYDWAGRISLRMVVNGGPSRKDQLFSEILLNQGLPAIYERRLRRTIRMEFADATLDEVCASIEAQSGLRIRIAVDESLPRVAWRGGEMLVETALDALAQEVVFVWHLGGDGAIVFYRLPTMVDVARERFAQEPSVTIAPRLDRRVVDIDLDVGSLAEAATCMTTTLGIPTSIEGADIRAPIRLALHRRDLRNVLSLLGHCAPCSVAIVDEKRIVLTAIAPDVIDGTDPNAMPSATPTHDGDDEFDAQDGPEATPTNRF